METIICDLCSQEMKLDARLQGKRKYRIRRFKCECGHTEAVFANGFRDNVVEPIEAKEQMELEYKNQSDSRDLRPSTLFEN